MQLPVMIWEKYLADTASREELEILDTWLQEAANEELAALMQNNPAEKMKMPTEMATRLRARLQQLPSTGKRLHAIRKSAIWWAAASILIAGLTGLFYMLNHRQMASPSQLAAVQWDSISNTSAHAQMLTLPDQTRIWLNKQAVLYIRKDYSKHREVRLQGEGYFDVAPDEAHPFRVTAGKVQTLVLGTAFNIDNTPGQSAVYISLVKGSVKVQPQSGDTAAVVLQPGETVKADYHGNHLSKTSVTDVSGWVKGQLVFNQLPLSEALPKLAAYYGIRIEADPALLRNKTVTAVYRQNETWQQVLHHLLFIYQLSYEVGPDQEIVIHS
ncbi:FecR family protein [Chitinophaga sp. HK235]|uniref:FecR family protein n=1 Tax=Chitinophaga sp. HK235 TaxID=2952571 RepID=UPI001BAC227E|nr:FecR domain-containing protein [Chitinophaga sp. HK235]